MTGGNLDEMLDEDPYGRRRRSGTAGRSGRAGRRPERDPEGAYPDPAYPDAGFPDAGYADGRYADADGRYADADFDDYAADPGYRDADYDDPDYPDVDRRGSDRRGPGRREAGRRGTDYRDTGYAEDDYPDLAHPDSAYDDDPADDDPADGEWRGSWNDDGEEVDAPRRGGRALPKLVAVLVVVAALLGLGIYGVGKVVGRVSGGSSAADYIGSGDGIAVVQVPDGASAREIAQELHEANVTASVSSFVKAAAANPKSLGIQPGTYRLRNRMSADAALAALLDPASSAPFRFVIKEGMSVQQVLAGLHDRLGTPMEELEAIARNPAQLGVPSYAPTLEGYFFPSTYDLVPGATPVQLMTSFVTRFKQETASLDLEHRAAAQGMTPAKIVTIASIIEKEVANADEGPKVARVIYNRLNDTTGGFRRLDMDSTTRYAQSEYTGPLSRAQLENTSNPYNTRAVAGLPPGAISNPGLWALKSALEPAAGTWLYFVSMPRTKVTQFATTTDEWDTLRAQYHAEGGKE